jgi:hypothetical protein
LWMMRELKIPVPALLVEAIIARCGAFPVVMFCHLNSRSIKSSPVRRRKLVEQIGELPFVGAFWVLAYEAVVNNWVTDAELPRDKMPFFMKEMLSKGVSFFDRNANPRFMRTDDEGAVTYAEQAIEDMAGRYDDDDNRGETRNLWGEC